MGFICKSQMLSKLSINARSSGAYNATTALHGNKTQPISQYTRTTSTAPLLRAVNCVVLKLNQLAAEMRPVFALFSHARQAPSGINACNAMQVSLDRCKTWSGMGLYYDKTEDETRAARIYVSLLVLYDILWMQAML